MQEAAIAGNEKLLEKLLATGADRSVRDARHGNIPLHEAAWRGYSRCVKLLCALPKPSKSGKEKDQKLLKGVLCATRGALHSAILGTRNFGGFSPLHLAAQNGHNQSCREILLAGGDPDVQNNYGDTPLQTACRYGHAGATRILLSGNCDVERVNLNGDSALHISCAMGRRKLTRILREAGGRCDIKNSQMETPRDIAVRKGLKEILEILDSPVQVDGKRDLSSTSSKQKRHQTKDTHDVVDNGGGRAKDHRSSRRRKDATKVEDEKKTPVAKKDEKKEDIQWSPYGCHYAPDPKAFPSPRLESLPSEPLGKGEQYFLDLAGNIRKGPVGVNASCYCGPFFKHIENKMHRNRKSLRKYVDRAAEKLDHKVQALAMKTEDQIGELTKSIITERIRCEGRRMHLEHWLKRGVATRATVAATPSKSRKDEENMNTLTRCKSLEMIENDFQPLANGNPNMSRSFDLLDHHQHVVEIHSPPKRDDSLIDNKSSGLGSERLDKQSISQVSDDSRFGNRHRNELRVNSKKSSERSSSLIGSDLTNHSSTGRDYRQDTTGPREELMSQQLGKLLTKTHEIIEMEKMARRRRMGMYEDDSASRNSVRRPHRLDSTGDMDSEYIAQEMEKITASLMRDQRPAGCMEVRNTPRRSAMPSYVENSSPEISKDRHTEKRVQGMELGLSAMMSGFYQNTGFSQDVPSSSSNTLKSERAAMGVSCGETPEDHVGDLPELTNSRDLNDLKNRILNGSQWKSQVLKKSLRESHHQSSGSNSNDEFTPATGQVEPSLYDIKSSEIKTLRKELMAAKMGKVHEIVARIQNNMMNQCDDDEDESESSEDEGEDEDDEEEEEEEEQHGEHEVLDNGHLQSHNEEVIDLTGSAKHDSPGAKGVMDFENFNNGILPANFCYRAEPQVANCRSGLQQQQSHMVPKDAYFHDISERRTEIVGRQPLPPPGLTEDDLMLQSTGSYYADQCHSNAMAQQQQQLYRPRLEYYHVYNNHSNQAGTSVDVHKEKLLASKKYQGYTNLMEMDMEKLVINGVDHMQLDRESNNDSGYSTKVGGGSSHGPSPSLSGNQVDLDILGPNFNLNTHPMANHLGHHPAAGPSLAPRNQPLMYHHSSYNRHLDANGPYIEGFNGTSSLV